ncbi:MAG: hypothetical protein KGP14_04010 [Betaproteobacteria bacterium]|nr:hypothetical protein [Betaproteobacteria bacterium]
MYLHPEWRRILRKAWSVRLAALAGTFAVVDAVLPLYVDSLPRSTFAVLAGVSAFGSIITRAIAQPRMWE